MLSWSLSGPLSQFDGSSHRTTCKLHRKRGDPAGVCRSPLRWLSQFLSYEKERIQLFMTLLLSTFFVVEWVGIYKGKYWLLSLLDDHMVSLPLGKEFPFPYYKG